MSDLRGGTFRNAEGYTTKLPNGRYFLVCECGSAEEVSKPTGRCEGCGAEYSPRDDSQANEHRAGDWSETYQE